MCEVELWLCGEVWGEGRRECVLEFVSRGQMGRIGAPWVWGLGGWSGCGVVTARGKPGAEGVGCAL